MRSAAIALVILAALPTVSAAGIDLSWNQCVTAAPADGVVWSCTPGEVTNLFANFQLPSGISAFVALDAVLDIELGTAVPPFWQFQTGGCNPLGVSVLDDRPAAECPAASNPTPWGAGGAASDAFITGYAPGFGATNRARLLVTVARAASSPTPLVAGQNYYGFHLAFSSAEATSCPGCNTPAEITWTSGTFFAPTGGPGGGAIALEVTAPGLRSKKVTVNGGLSGVTGFELFSITPNRASVGGPIAVVVVGRDILPGATLRLTRPLASPIVATGVTVAADGRSISGTLDLTTSADGLWDVEVTNPGGSTARLGSAFTIDASLSVSSVTPFELGPTGTFPVVVQGGGFEPGIDVRLRRFGLLDIVGSVTSIAADRRSLNCTFVLNGAATGTWSLVATNLDGETVTLAGGVRVIQGPVFLFLTPSVISNAGPVTFTIDGQNLDFVAGVSFEKSGQSPRVASSLTHLSPISMQATCDFAGAAIGAWDIVLSSSTTARGSNAVTVVVAPIFESIVPNQAGNGEPFTVTVNGQNFIPGVCSIELRRPGFATLLASGAVAADGRSAVGTFNPNYSPAATRDVAVSNAGISSNVLANGFTLLAAPRTNYLTPFSGPNVGPITVRASGSGYAPGASVRLLRSGLPDIVGTGVSVGPSDTSLTVTFDITDAAAGAWAVGVANPGGPQGRLDGAFFALATPVIDSVAPRKGGQQNAAQALTIFGRKFSTSLQVALRLGGVTRFGSNISVNPGGTQVGVTFNLNGLLAGNYDVLVTNLPGGTGTLAAGFTVIPQVVLNSPVPSSGLDTTSVQLLTITGAPLQPGAVVSLASGPTTLTGTNVVVNGAGTSLTATFDLRPGFDGMWSLNVTNPDGSFGSLANAFRIVQVPMPVSVVPASGVDTEIIPTIQVNGTRFTPGAQIALVRDGGATVPVSNEVVNAGGTQVSGSIDLRNVAVGAWHVRVTNLVNGLPFVSGTLTNAFAVAAGPRITAINPPGSEPALVFDATVTGSAFQPGAQVDLMAIGLPTISGTDEVTSPGGNQITVRFNLVGHAAGLRNVVVTNPDGHSTTLVNGFSVLSGPVVSFVSPTSAPDTGVAVISIGGGGLSALAHVWLRRTSQPNIDGTIISGNPAGTLIHATFDLGGKALGLWDVLVQNPSGATAAKLAAFEIRFIGPTSPAGLDLTWSACNLPASGGTSTVNFDCGNPDFTQTLYANFQSPLPVPDFIALDAVMDVNTAAASLPDFWFYDPAGCNANGLAISDQMPASACASSVNTNPWGLGGSAAEPFITAYVPNYVGGGRARMLVSVVRGITDPFSIVGGVNHFGFSLTWTGDLTICDGCTTPAEITWTSALLHSAAPGSSPIPISGTGLRSSVASVNGGLTGMDLTSIVPDRLVLGTLPRVRVFGRELTGASVALTRPGQPDILGAGVTYDADGHGLSATLDLSVALSGKWSVRATSGGSSAELEEAVRLLSTVPEVVVLAPQAGERLEPNRDYLVQWEAVDDELVTGIDLYLSRNGTIGPWELLAYDLSNSGSALTRINGPTTNNAYMRVVASDGDGHEGVGQSGSFSIQGATATLVARFEAVRSDVGAQVTWTFETPERVARVDLDRAPTASGPWTPVQADRETQDGTTIVQDRDPSAASSRYRLRATTHDGDVVTFGPIAVATGVAAPALSGVTSIAPNPASRRARIRLAVAREGPVRLSVLDLQGREVAVLADEVVRSGMHDIAWDARAGGRSLPPGLYFVRFADATRKQVTRLVLTP